MLFAALILAHPAAAAFQEAEAKPAEALRGRAEVWRLDKIETLDGKVLEDVTLVIREGLIEKMGQAVIVPDGARVHDLRGQGMVAMPPLVLTHANFLVQDQRGAGNTSRWRAVDSLWLAENWEQDLLREGVLFAGVDPPGSGLPGRTSVLAAGGGWPKPEALVNDLHLKLTLTASSQSKDLIRKALKDADEAIEKEKKARADWEKARADWDKKQKEKAEKEKAEGGEAKKAEGGKAPGGQEGEEKAPPEKFEPPAIAPDLVAVVEWIRQERLAQVWLASAADWVHWKDVLLKRELPYELVLRHGLGQNLHEVGPELAKAKVRIDLPALISFLPFTRIRVNLPAELVRDGLEHLILSPENDSLRALMDWRTGVARCVAEGLPRERALQAMTLEPALSMGQESQVQVLKAGAPANFVVWSGDPLDPMAHAAFVVRDGKIVYDRAREDAKEAR
jgi:hypothetical protein